LNLDLSRVRL